MIPIVSIIAGVKRALPLIHTASKLIKNRKVEKQIASGLAPADTRLPHKIEKTELITEVLIAGGIICLLCKVVTFEQLLQLLKLVIPVAA